MEARVVGTESKFTLVKKQNMASADALNLGGLTMKFAGLDLSEAASLHEDAFPVLNPVDILRSAITEELTKISGAYRNLIYPALSWTKMLDKGDRYSLLHSLG